MGGAAPATANGTSWSEVAATEANQWVGVAYGNGVWVAVGQNGTNRVMRSSDPAAAAADPAAGSVVETVTFDWGLSGVSSTPITASRGSWVPLPESTTATGAPVVTKESGENLCGFATTKDFPVAIAKRQVANSW